MNSKTIEDHINSIAVGILEIQKTNRRFAEVITRNETDLSQVLVLLLLQLKLTGGMKITEIAEAFCITAGGATAMCDKLEEENFVTRERSKEDRRIVRVVLTELGHERIKKIFKNFSEETLVILDESLKNASAAMWQFLNHVDKKE